MFACGGLFVWGMAFRQFASNRRRVVAIRERPGEMAFADYNWNGIDYAPPRWRKFLKFLAISLLMTLLISVLNWWAFVADGPWMVKGIVGIFDLILVLVWADAFRRLLHALKFGGSRIIFDKFPYRIDVPLKLRWVPASGITTASRGSFTLRCVREYYESSGNGKSQSLVKEVIWEDELLLEEEYSFVSGDEVSFNYSPPSNLPKSSLGSQPAIFWEFEVKLDVPGLDFEETYLVPLY
jgi:hypothetical protein